eukprot:NODE_3020_length_1045_cov_33.419390_g2878_i0.p1 GENE.NODE_3020_length_1045_cov_33.419390_g2878_i0~~NODE_3020_length_1045_cov_33.419390_g2878_i0.p1  ORF type:complete len:321 (-),score=49.19 NODE_3020_length_1045_cov_33.419390_g2878_i0:17-979(-)
MPHDRPNSTSESCQLLQHILTVRQEIALLQTLIAQKEMEAEPAAGRWVLQFDRQLLQIYSSEAPPFSDRHSNNKRLCEPPIPDSHTSYRDLCTLYSIAPPACCPINIDVKDLDFTEVSKICKFDAVVIDPPWDLIKLSDQSVQSATRGVELGYGVLRDDVLVDLKIGDLVDDGFIFLWGINSKWELCFDLLKAWGFEYFTLLHWVKQSRKTGKMAKGHGFYLMHAKEAILVGRKGHPKPACGFHSDILLCPRSLQSAKPDELYELIEKMFPNGRFIDIFARLTSLRSGWVSVGNELNVPAEYEVVAAAKDFCDTFQQTGY